MELISVHVPLRARGETSSFQKLILKASTFVPPLPQDDLFVRHIYHEHFGLTSNALDSLSLEEHPRCEEFLETFFDTPNRDLLAQNCWLRCREYLGRNQIVWTLKREVILFLCSIIS